MKNKQEYNKQKASKLFADGGSKNRRENWNLPKSLSSRREMFRLCEGTGIDTVYE